MSDRKILRAGLIGYGIGKFYAAALRSVDLYYTDLPAVELTAVATAGEASGQQAVQQSGFKRHTRDYRDLLASGDIDLIVIASPNYLHRDMLIDALHTDKAIYIDKPLANDLDEAREMMRIARETKRDAQMIFEIRYCPAVQQARRFIEAGRLGQVYAFRGAYFRSSYADPARPLRWKASLAQSGGGVLADYAPHLIDLVLWLIGKPDQVAAQMRTFVTDRPVSAGGVERVPVETDDHVIVQLAMPDGAIGTIEAGRMITGCVNDLSLEIYGSDAAVRWSLAEPNSLYWADRKMPADERGWLRIPTNARFADAALVGTDLPVGMMQLHMAGMAEFLRRTLDHRPYDPGLEQGFRVQAVIEAATQAARQNQWIKVVYE